MSRGCPVGAISVSPLASPGCLRHGAQRASAAVLGAVPGSGKALPDGPKACSTEDPPVNITGDCLMQQSPTRFPVRRPPEVRWTNAAITAGPPAIAEAVPPADPAYRRRMASWCRNTRISASFAASDRANSTIQPTNRHTAGSAELTCTRSRRRDGVGGRPARGRSIRSDPRPRGVGGVQLLRWPSHEGVTDARPEPFRRPRPQRDAAITLGRIARLAAETPPPSPTHPAAPMTVEPPNTVADRRCCPVHRGSGRPTSGAGAQRRIE